MDGNMRRLPPWMLAGASSGVTATSNRSVNKSDEGIIIKDEAEARKTNKKRKTRRETDNSDIEEPKKVEIRRRGGVGRNMKIKEEKGKPIIDDVKGPEIIQEDLTVDDLLSFAQEYVKGEESLSTSNSMLVDVIGESNMKASQVETNGTRDPTSDDMINLLLGPFFNTRK